MDYGRRITGINTAVTSGLLGYPSLNEINYTAFGAVTEEYHDELWGYIEEKQLEAEYKKDKETRPYKRMKKDGTVADEQRTLSHYIRDQIHHPENKLNERFTPEDLKKSVEEMREFIKAHRA